MDSNEIYNEIDKYLQGVLNQSARKDFEKRLEQEHQLRLLVETHQEVDDYFKDRSSLHRLRSRIEGVENGRYFLKRRLWSVAASIFLLVGLAIGYLILNPSPDQLYDRYFELPSYFLQSPISTERGKKQIGMNDRFKEARELFDRNQITEALAALSSDEEGMYFHRGLLLMKTDQWDQAIDAFNQAMKVRPEASSWYMALCYLKQGDFEQSKEVLLKFIEYKNPYTERARKLLDVLDSSIQ